MTVKHTNSGPCESCELKLKTARVEMRHWFIDVVKVLYNNAHVSWSWRGQMDQDKFFMEGRTKLKFPKSPHNRVNTSTGEPESDALDLFQLDEQGRAKFDPMFYAELNDHCERLGCEVFWGGKFKTLGDADHFQYKAKV